MAECPHHENHEHRIETLEGQMQIIQNERVSAGRWLAIVTVAGSAFTGIMSFLGVLVGMWAKAHGWM